MVTKEKPEAPPRKLVEASLREEVRRLQSLVAARDDIDVATQKLGAHVVRPPAFKLWTKKSQQAVPVAVLSDVHAGESVEWSQTNGKNRYDPDLCRLAIDRFFQEFIGRVDWCAQRWSIRGVTVALLGDLMTGYLHEDHRETNRLSPPQEVVFLQSIIKGWLLKLQELYGRVYVPCCFGNHGRSTTKPRSQNAAATSWEWLLYKHLEDLLSQNRDIVFDVAEGTLLYSDILGQTIRWTHGDKGISYSGKGQATTGHAVRRAAGAWDQTTQADLTVIGHFHTIESGPRVVVNGSTIGLSAYGIDIAVPAEEPAQAFFVVTKDSACANFEAIKVSSAKERERG